MKKLKLIYNSDAGNRSFKTHLDSIFSVLIKAGFDISILRVEKINQIEDVLSKSEGYDTIIAAGGDGTLNMVISCVIKYDIKAKIGIIPAGTSNDFARSIGISKNFTTGAETVAKGFTKNIDIGQITTKSGVHYFVNVFGAGTLTNISHYVDPNLKNTIGNMAYYLKAVEKFQDNTPIPVTITTSTSIIKEEIYFFLALNTGAAGGFDMLAKDASINDGYFDMLALKTGSIPDTLGLIMKFFRGEHLTDERIIYYRDNYTKLDFEIPTETNIDGESGPNPPIEINLLQNAVTIYVP